jgi:tRNA (adenine57-N1/adenine58-N1)-methyltransferase
LTADEHLPAAQAGNQVLLVSRDRKQFIIRLEPGAQFHTHRGVLSHDELMGSPWGALCSTHTGYPFLLLRPSIDDIIRNLKRTTQIVYPKDAGYTMMKMSITPGSHVIEAGTGSGAMTIMLARAVAPMGRIYSYEIRPDIQNLARKNLERMGLDHLVELRLHDIGEGLFERGVDAVFLDLPKPWDYLSQAHDALIGGGFFGCILPTTNQVVDLLGRMEQYGFGLAEVEELLLRPYKAVSARLRPMDRIVAHTGYLVFARALTPEKAGREEDYGETT